MNGRSLAAAALIAASLAAQGRAEEKKTTSLRNIVPASGERGAVGGLRVAELNADGKTARNVADGAAVRSGKRVKLCFEVSRRGYVSLWSQSAAGDLSRIVPNRFMVEAQADAVAVRPGEYCVAENGLVDAAGEQASANRKPWWFEVREPYGEAELFLYWTAEAKQQPPEEPVVDIDALDAEIGKKRSASRCVGCSSSAAYAYRVVRAGGGQ